MDKNIDQLAAELMVNTAFLNKLFSLVGKKNKKETSKLVNEIKSIKEDVGADSLDEALDFYASQNPDELAQEPTKQPETASTQQIEVRPLTQEERRILEQSGQTTQLDAKTTLEQPAQTESPQQLKDTQPPSQQLDTPQNENVGGVKTGGVFSEGLSDFKKDFLNKYAQAALKTEAETGVPAKLILSQAALESNWGRSGLTKDANNFFGIKGEGPAGSTVRQTKEDTAQGTITTQAGFRKYSSPEESFKDHARLLTENPQYYKDVMDTAAETKDYKALAKAIHDSPYATDKQYDQKLINIMEETGLKDFDVDNYQITKQGEITPLETDQQPSKQTSIPEVNVDGMDQRTAQFTKSIFGKPVEIGVKQGASNAVDIHTGGVNTGEDYFVPTGTEVFVPPGEYEVVKTYNRSTDNTVVQGNIKTPKRYENSGYGNQVVLKDKKTGEEHRFNHLSEVNLEQGKTVKGGKLMGKTGATGNVVGAAHLDYEIFDPKGNLKNVREWDAFDDNDQLKRTVNKDTDYFKMTQADDQPEELSKQTEQILDEESAGMIDPGEIQPKDIQEAQQERTEALQGKKEKPKDLLNVFSTEQSKPAQESLEQTQRSIEQRTRQTPIDQSEFEQNVEKNNVLFTPARSEVRQQRQQRQQQITDPIGRMRNMLSNVSRSTQDALSGAAKSAQNVLVPQAHASTASRARNRYYTPAPKKISRVNTQLFAKSQYKTPFSSARNFTPARNYTPANQSSSQSYSSPSTPSYTPSRSTPTAYSSSGAPYTPASRSSSSYSSPSNYSSPSRSYSAPKSSYSAPTAYSSSGAPYTPAPPSPSTTTSSSSSSSGGSIKKAAKKLWGGVKKFFGWGGGGGGMYNNYSRSDFKRFQNALGGGGGYYRAFGGGGNKKPLNKPIRTSGERKAFKVYVKDPKTGNVKTVRFGDPNMKDRSNNPKARKAFRARHNCANPGPKTKARYWACKQW